MAMRVIRKQNIKDVVYEQLKKAIVAGEWQQGNRIPSENELAATLGVSRVSVRSALQSLSSLGLVESRQGEGTFVCRFSGTQYIKNLIPILMLGKPETKNLMEFRMIFDCGIAGLAAEHCGPDVIGKLKSNYKKHKGLSGDTKKAAECDLEFHSLLAEATENPLLIEVYAVLKDVFLSALYDIVAVMGTTNALVFHKKIIEALEAHDAPLARDIMRQHIQDTIEAAVEGKFVPQKEDGEPPQS